MATAGPAATRTVGDADGGAGAVHPPVKSGNGVGYAMLFGFGTGAGGQSEIGWR